MPAEEPDRTPSPKEDERPSDEEEEEPELFVDAPAVRLARPAQPHFRGRDAFKDDAGSGPSENDSMTGHSREHEEPELPANDDHAKNPHDAGYFLLRGLPAEPRQMQKSEAWIKEKLETLGDAVYDSLEHEEMLRDDDAHARAPLICPGAFRKAA